VRRDWEHAHDHLEPGGAVTYGPAHGIEASEILTAVDRIRKSHAMKGCRRLAQLLTFVVDATLKGDADHLKETTIGVFVFGRSPDYDPKVDSIVRSQAWRLRAKLKKYYASEGARDPVIVEVPVGHYVPIFSLRDPMQEPGWGTIPKV
jgi:hypothetical protein